MARAFVPNQEIVGTTTVAKNQTYFSMSAWIRRITSGSTQFVGFAQTATSWLGIFPFTDNILYFLNGDGVNTLFGSVSSNITGWNHYLLTFDGSQSTNSGKLKGYVNGIAQTLSFNSNQPATTNNLAETFKIGKREVGSNWSTGDFAEIGMWQATLTNSEAESLAKGMTCEKVRPQSLVTYIPLVRDIQDLARGMTLTNTNSTVATHPRVYA